MAEGASHRMEAGRKYLARVMAEMAVNEPREAAIVGSLPEAAHGAECQDLRMTRDHCARGTALHQRDHGLIIVPRCTANPTMMTSDQPGTLITIPRARDRSNRPHELSWRFGAVALQPSCRVHLSFELYEYLLMSSQSVPSSIC